MVRIGDFEVVVKSSGIALPEFDDEDATDVLVDVQGPAIVKYLQARANTEFMMEFKSSGVAVSVKGTL
jgi:hypothetical protein